MHYAVRIFRNTVVEARFSSLVVSLCVIAMRLGLFSVSEIPSAGFPDTGYLWRFCEHWFSDPTISFIAATLSVFLIAWMIARLNSRFSLIRNRTHLPFIVPLILFSVHPYFLRMTPDYISIFFILCALFPLLSSFHRDETYLYSAQSGVFLAIASLFQIYSLLLVPLWWRGEASMHGVHLRSFLSSFFAVLLVFWSVFSVCFFFDDLPAFTAPFSYLALFSLPDLPAFSPGHWVLVIAVGLFFGVYMFLSIKTYIRDKVLTLSAIQFMIYLLIFLLLFQMVYWSQGVFFLSLGIALLSYLIAYFYTLTTSKVNIYAGYFVFLLLIGYYVLNYFSLFPAV
ncbi:hypothetical protein [Limibacterium fermenti]|uniref:hypothetical protein n=1 Tax=Limibacterium fermenti TaxID=3229863 RepID=UPI000E88FB02|nr:hypothetical protein [Porphyromonadaceae bacterium]